MKYHKQEHLHKPDVYPSGSCYPTVYACLLDLELNEVPYFHLLYFSTSKEKELLNRKVSEDFQKKVQNLWNDVRTIWLYSKGYEEEWITDTEKWLLENPEKEYIVHGISPRNVGHVVVYKGDKMIHDPHPSNSGLVKVDYFSYLRKIDGEYEFDRYYIKTVNNERTN